jgi:uncharacterized membrane protein YoaK (UPF0700 family)
MERSPKKKPAPLKETQEAVVLTGTSVLLATAGGYLDGFTYVGHGHVFANAMTGNVVLLGVNCVSGSWQTGFRHLPPILAFLLGISAARAIQVPSVQKLLRYPYMTVLVFEMAVFFFLSLLPASVPDFWITISIAFAASVQVETFRKVHGHSYNSTFTTGNLRTLSESIFDWLFLGHSSDSAKIVRDFSMICLAFFAGAVGGGYLTPRLGNRALWIDLALLLLVAIRVWPRPHPTEQSDS